MRGEEKRNLRECKGGEASTFAASPQPYLGEARGHPIRTVPGGAPCGLLIPRSTRGAHRRARPSRPQPLIRPGPGQAARGVRTMSPARPELPPTPRPGAAGSPDGHPALGVVQALQAAEEVRQRVRSVAREDDHEHRGSLQGRLGENHRLLVAVLGVRLGGEARPAAAAHQSPGEEQQRES